MLEGENDARAIIFVAKQHIYYITSSAFSLPGMGLL